MAVRKPCPNGTGAACAPVDVRLHAVFVYFSKGNDMEERNFFFSDQKQCGNTSIFPCGMAMAAPLPDAEQE